MTSKQYLTLKIRCILHAMIISFYNAKCCFTEFAELQKKSEFERAEWVRRQGMLSFFVLNHILVVEELLKIFSHTQVLTSLSTSVSRSPQNVMCI